MTRHALAAIACLSALAASSPAGAKPIDFDGCEYDCGYGRERAVRGSAGIASGSAVMFRVPDGDGGLEPFGSGAGLALGWIDVGGDFPTGFEADAVFITGEDGGRFYDLGLSLIGSAKLADNLAVPFASVGLDISGVSLPADNGASEGGMALGVHGNVGLHGFLSDDIYWRGQIGYLGAALGGVKAQLSVGWVFGRD